MPATTVLHDIECEIGTSREPLRSQRVIDDESALIPRILAAFFTVYRELGYALVPELYVRALITELALRELPVTRDAEFPAFYRGCKIGSCRIDLLVERRVLLSVRAAPCIDERDRAHLISTWRCSRIESALLVNFGVRPDYTCLTGGHTTSTQRAGVVGAAQS